MTFIQGDIRQQQDLDQAFASHQIDAVIHFAGLKAVGESQQIPLTYFDNNIAGSVQLVQAMERANVFNLVFSSSATVYDEANISPLDETMPTGMPTNNYGYTKLIVEQLLEKLSIADERWSIALLRYFNLVGAHKSGRIGEDPQGIPNNLMPYVTQVAVGRREKLSIYGDDYDTVDGTGVRDYIHVVDLAKAHVIALQRLLNKKNTAKVETFNLGTGTGSSVLEVIHTFEKVSGKKLPYKIVARREGDVTSAYANTDKANNVLGWKAQSTLEQAMASAWKWEQKIRS